jgi:hypothetical protein
MTVRKKRRQVCKFATFGPDGSVGFFARGEHKLPDENPDQPEFSFVQRAYVVKERKPIARSTGRRMRYSKWKEVSRHDTLTSAKRGARLWHPPGTHRDWRKQRAIFFEGKRVSDGDRLMPKYRGLPEQP